MSDIWRHLAVNYRLSSAVGKTGLAILQCELRGAAEAVQKIGCKVYWIAVQD